MNEQTPGKTERSPVDWMRWVPAGLLALLFLTAIVISGRIVLLPLLSSLALTYLLAPVVAWFERRGWSRSASVILTMIASTLVLVLILIFILPSFWSQASKSYEQAKGLLSDERLASLEKKIIQINPQLKNVFGDQKNLSLNEAQVERLTALVWEWLQKGLFRLVDLTSSVLDLLLIPFFVYYFLADYVSMRSRLDRLIPPRHRGIASDLFGQINHVISSYVRNQLVIALVMGVLYSLGFLILRVPLAVTIGMLSGLLNFVPYLGTLTGLVLAIGFAALNGAGIGSLIGILAVFVIVQSVEGYYLTPKLLGSKLDLHPMWVLVGLMIGGNLFGLLGIILAVPVIAIGKVVIAFLENLYQQSEFYRQPGFSLLTSQGRPVEILDPASIASASQGQGTSPEESPSVPGRRTIITTAELRSRVRETTPVPED